MNTVKMKVPHNVPLRLIQVGMGDWGLSWAELVNKSPDWEQVAFVSRDQSVLGKIMSQYRISPDCYYDQIDTAFKKTKADALLITTPFFTHAELALKGLEAGLHVLVEKPMADSMENARLMIREAEKRGLILMVAEDFRYNRVPRTIRRLLQEKIAGDPQNVFVWFNTRHTHILPEGDWRKKVPYPLLMESGVHHFDLARYMLGSEALKISAMSWNPAREYFEGDTASAVAVEMERGIVLGYMGDWAHGSFETQPPGNWKIWCAHGGISWENGILTVVRDNGEIIKPDLTAMEYQGRECVLNEFVQSIKNNRVPETSGEDNIRSLAVSLAAIESARTGRKVEIGNM